MNRKLQNRIEVAGRTPPKEGEASDGDLIAEVELSKNDDGLFTYGINFAVNPDSFQDPEFPMKTAIEIERMAMDLATYLGRCRTLYKK